MEFNGLENIVNDETNVMYYSHMHYVNQACNPSYTCWKNNSLWHRLKYRLLHILRNKRKARDYGKQ